jgi:hypothetical protein
MSTPHALTYTHGEQTQHKLPLAGETVMGAAVYSPAGHKHTQNAPGVVVLCYAVLLFSRLRCVSMLADLYHSPCPPEDAVGAACIGSSEAIMLAGG